MLRRISLAAATAAMLAAGALPASAAVMSSSTHAIKFPGLHGLSASGSYKKSGSRVKVSVCVKDTARNAFAAGAVTIAYNSNYSKHQEFGAVAVGYKQTSCTSMTLPYSSHLRVYTFVGGSNGRIAATSKTKSVY